MTEDVRSRSKGVLRFRRLQAEVDLAVNDTESSPMLASALRAEILEIMRGGKSVVAEQKHERSPHPIDGYSHLSGRRAYRSGASKCQDV